MGNDKRKAQRAHFQEKQRYVPMDYSNLISLINQVIEIAGKYGNTYKNVIVNARGILRSIEKNNLSKYEVQKHEIQMRNFLNKHLSK